LTSSSNKIMSASCLFLNSKVTNPIRGYLCTWVIGLCSNDSLLLVAKMVKKNEFISDSVISNGIFYTTSFFFEFGKSLMSTFLI